MSEGVPIMAIPFIIIGVFAVLTIAVFLYLFYLIAGGVYRWFKRREELNRKAQEQEFNDRS